MTVKTALRFNQPLRRKRYTASLRTGWFTPELIKSIDKTLTGADISDTIGIINIEDLQATDWEVKGINKEMAELLYE